MIWKDKKYNKIMIWQPVGSQQVAVIPAAVSSQIPIVDGSNSMDVF